MNGRWTVEMFVLSDADSSVLWAEAMRKESGSGSGMEMGGMCGRGRSGSGCVWVGCGPKG